MRNCGNCANYNHERLCHTDVCGKCFVEGANGKCGTPSKWKTKPLTNGDRIRAMTDEELATFLDCFSGCAVCRESERLDDNPFLKDEKCDEDCEAHILEWLKQPAEEEK